MMVCLRHGLDMMCDTSLTRYARAFRSYSV